MAWTTLILGALLMAIGIGGQIFGIRKTSTLAPSDRRARNWIFTVGSLVVGPVGRRLLRCSLPPSPPLARITSLPS